MSGQYTSENIAIYEWPHPCCEIVSQKGYGHIAVTSREDAMAIVESLRKFLEEIDSQ